MADECAAQGRSRTRLGVERHNLHLFRPPFHVFHRQKIAFAKNLLADTSLLVKEIAALLGFEDPFYFSAQFRKHVGLSPRTYQIGRAHV
jgi:AraC family transcriptional regulator, transcriptional activator of pobA